MASDENPFEAKYIKEWSAQLDLGRQKILQEAVKEFRLYTYMDSPLPTSLTVQQAERLLMLDGRRQRLRYFTFLGRKERMAATQKQRQAEKAARAAEIKDAVNAERLRNAHLTYALGYNAIFRRIIDSSMNRTNEARLLRLAGNAPSVAFDLSPMRELSPMEVDLTWCQLRECYFVNRSHRAPFNLHFNCCDPSLPTWMDNERYFKGGLDQYTVNWGEKTMCETFPREKLIYLSPDARQMLHCFQPDKVYVIAAMVDRPNKKNWTLGKAKELGIPAFRLPFDLYVKWQIGSKTITLNQVLAILLDVADNGGNWTEAIVKHVPKRKLIPKASECGKRIRQANHQRCQSMLSMLD